MPFLCKHRLHYLLTSNYCNFKCSFCPRNYDDFSNYAGSFKHMPISLFKKIVDDLKAFPDKLKVLRLFFLGEPLLCPDFLSILKLAVTENIAERIEISTNASMLTENLSKEIINTVEKYKGNFYLRVSIYSVLQEKNEAITKSKISVDKIYKNVAFFKQYRDLISAGGIRVYAKMLDSYSDENEQFLNMYRSAVDEVEIEEPMNWSGYEGRDLLASTYSPSEIQALHNKKMPKVCAYPFHTLAIQSDGNAVCCCVDWTRHTLVGNVNNESLFEIWHGDKLRNLQLLHLSGKV